MEITEKQTRVLNFIKDFITEKKYSPSVREISKAIGYKSSKSAHDIIKELEKKGIISKKSRLQRSITVVL